MMPNDTPDPKRQPIDGSTEAENTPDPRQRPIDGSAMAEDTPDPRKQPIDGCAIGWRFNEQLRRPGAMERTRAKMIAWKQQRDQEIAERDAWLRRRDEFFRNRVANDSRLRDQAAGPPAEDWEYKAYILHETLADETRSSSLISAWCPPDLFAGVEPRVHSPVSFCACSGYVDKSDPERPLSIEEKYVVCMAFRDAFCAGVERIDPWTEQPEDFPGLVARAAYATVRREVKKLHEADRPAVEAFLADVTADLDAALGRAEEEAASAREGAEKNSPAYTFRRDGDGWDVRFAGEEHGHFKHIVGFGMIRRLLASPNPGKPLSATELTGRHSRAAGSQSSQSVLDRRGKTEIERRLADLEELIRQARQSFALAKVAEYEAESARLKRQKQKDLGLGGKPRRLGPTSEAERARDNVRKALDRAYAAMEHAVPPLSDLIKHLRQSIQPEGDGYSYRPVNPPDWQLT